MDEVVGVRFKSCGKLYDFETAGVELNPGDMVVVESEMGLSIGRVIRKSGATSGAAGHKAEHKKILRVASEADLKEAGANVCVEKEAFLFCRERVTARGLQMKLIRTECTLDRKRIIFYFIAEKRIDFRELVKDLAQKFHTRIEMRQIGVRDEAKMTGGLGLCGRELCCTSFLVDFAPISIKMAKKQELVLNTGKLSGICGRLMCCLGYEYVEGQDREAAQEDIEESPAPPDPVPAAREHALSPQQAREKGRREQRRRHHGPSPDPSPDASSLCAEPREGRQEESGQVQQTMAPLTAGQEDAGESAVPGSGRRKRKRKWRRRGSRGDKNRHDMGDKGAQKNPQNGKPDGQ